MDCLPKGWMHDEIVEMIDAVASKIGAVPPQDEGRGGSETSLQRSPFVRRVRIPFGRKTGVAYGQPLVEVTLDAVADALLSLDMSEYSDSRRRIMFEEVDPKTFPDGSTWQRLRQVQEDEEDCQTLETLELDRYLLDPDLLYDIDKRRQRRRVTSRETIRLPTFRTQEEAITVADHDEDSAMEIGRGSVQNARVPVPYVRGRRGF